MKPLSIALAGLMLAAPLAQAWTLDGDASAISYVSIKNASTAEANLLPGLSGSVADDGTASIEIALSSVETYVDIRNERLQEHLFDVATYPVATLSAELDMDALAAQAEGSTVDMEFPVTVTANGQEVNYDVLAAVTRVGADRVAVSSRQPVILYADEFGYEVGLAKLQEIAGLDSIQITVPVTFTLLFDR